MNVHDKDLKIMRNNFLSSSIDPMNYASASASGTGTICVDNHIGTQNESWMNNTINVKLEKV